MNLLRPAIRWLPLASLTVTLALFSLHLPELADGNWSRLGASALDQTYPILLLLFAAYGLRGTSVLQIVGSTMTGFFTAFLLAQTAGGLATEIMGKDGVGRLTVVVPIIEESIKLLPLGIVLWFWRRREGASSGALDMGLIGMAAGAGFAFHEDALWGRLSGSGFDGVGWLLPSVHSEFGLVAGHLVWTGLVGVALGIALSRTTRIWLFLPAGALMLAIVDHGTWNSPDLRETLGWLSANGWLPILGMLAGLIVAFRIDVNRLRSNSEGEQLRRREVLEFISTRDGEGPYAGLGRFRRWLVGSRLLRAQALLAFGQLRASRQKVGVR